MKLSHDAVGNLLASAEQSMFPEFWSALIGAARETGLAPVRLLGGSRGFMPRFEEPARTVVARLQAVECPFDLEHSRWGSTSMLGAFRRLAIDAGIPEADTIEFDVLYS